VNGERYDARLRSFGNDGARSVHPIEIRHAEIEDRDVRVQLAHQSQRSRPSLASPTTSKPWCCKRERSPSRTTE